MAIRRSGGAAMSNAKRDTTTTSRKGRPKVGSRAMTPAERKRRQRQKVKEAKASDPSWLRLRKEILAMMFDKFPFADIEELAAALETVGMAIRFANMAECKDYKERAANALRAVFQPEAMEDYSVTHPEFLPYVPNPELKENYPRAYGRSLIDLYCDIFDSHESNEDTDE
jgi:hypothetical protein